MDTKILAAKNLLKDIFGGYSIVYAIGIGCTILVLFVVSKRFKIITDILGLPFQIFRTVQSMLLIAQLVLFAFVAIILYKIWMIISLFAPVASFVADDRGAHNVKEEQVNAAKIENTVQKNTKEKENNELSEEAKIAAILAQLDEYDFTPTRREKFWYNIKYFLGQHSLDIIVSIALIIAYRLFAGWRANKHQSNIRYRNSLRQKARQARRKKNFWLDPIGTLVNLPYFSVLGSYIGEDGQIEMEMQQQGRENVMVPNAQNAPNQPQNKMSKILALAAKNKRTIFFVMATIITTMITILFVRYLLRKNQTEPKLKGEESEDDVSLEEEDRAKEAEEESEEKEEEALILELSEDMDKEEEEPKLKGEESEDDVSLEEDNLDVLSSKLSDEEAEETEGLKEESEEKEEGVEQTTSVLTDQEVAEGEEGQKAKKTPIWGILSTLVLVVAMV